MTNRKDCHEQLNEIIQKEIALKMWEKLNDIFLPVIKPKGVVFNKGKKDDNWTKVGGCNY